MKNSNFLLIVAISILFSSCGCGKKKTEREKFESLKSGTKYSIYKTLSKNTVGPAFSVYDLARPKDSVRTTEPILRLILGYSWAVTQKSAFAVAESEIIQQSDAGTEMKFLAHILSSLVMYEEGWKVIAKEESDKGLSLIKKNPDMKYSKEHIMAYHLLIGTVMIYEKQFDAAKFHFKGFGTVTGINWPYLLVDAMADINDKKIQQGLIKIKAISKDPSIPKELREHLAKTIADIEKKTGDVDALLFWPRLVSSILFDNIKNATNSGFQELMKVIGDLRTKLDSAL